MTVYSFGKVACFCAASFCVLALEQGCEPVARTCDHYSSKRFALTALEALMLADDPSAHAVFH